MSNDIANTQTIESPSGSPLGVDPIVTPRIVSVLCAARNSVYHDLPGVAVYDARLDARTFAGETPIVAHPPCRAWSVKTKHQAKPEPGEKELGLWCCEMLLQCGGVLEQPAFSEMFEAAGFPTPSTRRQSGDVWTLEVWQAWWGYPMKKATCLAFCGVPRAAIELPFRLHPRGGDRRTEQRMSKSQRSATTRAFAEWLVSAARSAV